jgi:hypothetical protein
VRVLHLVDGGGRDGAGCLSALIAGTIAALSDLEHVVLVLGTARDVASIRHAGLEVAGAISVPRVHGTVAPLWKLLERWDRAGKGFDVLHSWGTRSAEVIDITTRPAPHVATIDHVDGREPRELTSLQATRDWHLPVVAGSDAVASTLAAEGVMPWHVHVASPVVDPGKLAPRSAVRAAWGVDDDIFMVGVPAAPASWSDIRLAVTAIVRLAMLAPQVRLVLDPRSTGRARWHAWARSTGMGHVLQYDSALSEPWRTVAGLDAVLLGGVPRRSRRVPSRQPVAWCLAAGVPVVCAESNPGAELLQPGTRSMVVSDDGANDAVRRLLELTEDARNDVEQGLAWAEESCGAGASATLYQKLYDAVATPPSARSSA